MTKNNLFFKPHWLVRNKHLQTIIASKHVIKNSEMAKTAKEVMLTVDIDDGVKLQGFYAAPPKNLGKGLILLLHGWWGSSEATYIMAIGESLHQQGYSTFRLNMRDHGNTAHLNKGFFHGGRQEEGFLAAHQIANIEPNNPFYMIGFSIGANFGLRFAAMNSERPIKTLRHVISIGPAVKPKQALINSDKNIIYKHYFLRKWRKKLIEKSSLFPELFDFSEVLKCNSLNKMAEMAILEFAPVKTSEAYYKIYNVTADTIKAINVPNTIIMAEDDPIVDIADIKAFEGLNPLVNFCIQPYGGHIGFIHLFPFRRWLNEALLTILEAK